jgi:hypothetical protein
MNTAAESAAIHLKHFNESVRMVLTWFAQNVTQRHQKNCSLRLHHLEAHLLLDLAVHPVAAAVDFPERPDQTDRLSVILILLFFYKSSTLSSKFNG